MKIPQTEARKLLNRAFSLYIENEISQYEFFKYMHDSMDLQYTSGFVNGQKDSIAILRGER